MNNRQRSVPAATIFVVSCMWLSLTAIRAADSPPGPDAVTIYPYPCEPRECRANECGMRFDGCGGVIDCGTCGTCNNGSCEPGETACNCAADCGPCPGATPTPPPGPGPSPTPPPPGTNVVPTANPGGPYAGKVYEPIAFDGTASSDPQGDTTIVTYQWDFGDLTSGSGALVPHEYRAVNTYQVTLTVTDDIGHANQAATTATIAQTSGERYFATQALKYAPNLNRLQATASLSIGPEDGALYTPQLKVLLASAAGTVADTTTDGDYSYRDDSPRAGTWTLQVGYYYVSKANPALEPMLVASKTSTVTIAATPPPAAVTINGPQALWWFGGASGDGNHPTTIDLSASPISGPCSWTLAAGGDKASLASSGCTASLSSLAPSTAQGDVKVQATVGTETSPPFAVTVSTPYRLSGSFGGPFDTRPLLYGYDTVISEELVDQFNRTVRGLTIREEFGNRVNYQGTDWPSPSNTQFFAPSGRFQLHISQACDPCTPLPVSDPYSFEANQRVFGINELWWADPGGGAGVRVQSDVQLWSRGYGELTFVTR